MADRRALFNEWAEHYDASVDDESGFPFTGYRAALATTLSAAALAPGQSVLDVGCGSGNLSLLFALAGCKVTGVDFSRAMLELARQRVPGACFLELDLLGCWASVAGQQFDAIVSAYVFHEFDLEHKLTILTHLAAEHLKPGSRLVVADISFTTCAEMDTARADLADVWDDDEFYWSAEEAIAAIRQLGLSVAYTHVPPFAGVYLITATRT